MHFAHLCAIHYTRFTTRFTSQFITRSQLDSTTHSIFTSEVYMIIRNLASHYNSPHASLNQVPQWNASRQQRHHSGSHLNNADGVGMSSPDETLHILQVSAFRVFSAVQHHVGIQSRKIIPDIERILKTPSEIIHNHTIFRGTTES